MTTDTADIEKRLADQKAQETEAAKAAYLERRAGIMSRLFVAIDALEWHSQLDPQQFADAVVLLVRQDPVLRAALERSEGKTYGRPDATQVKLPVVTDSADFVMQQPK